MSFFRPKKLVLNEAVGLIQMTIIVLFNIMDSKYDF